MTAQEALSLLNDMEFDKKYQGKQEYAEMLLVCKEALEKQIPKKPYKRKEGKETNYYCSCKHYLGDETEIQLIAIRPRFCGNCGQALDWSDTNV